jgi:hypothetical protein
LKRCWSYVAAWAGVVLVVAIVTACASEPQTLNSPEFALARASDSSWGQGWEHFKLPGKQASEYAPVRLDGRDALAARSKASASLLRKTVRVEPPDLPRIRFSWMVPELIGAADLAVRDKADSPVRIVLAFEGDRSKFSAKNAMLSELSRAITGEPIPYATLIYVWSNTRTPGTVIINPRTDRVRKLVVESGGTRLNQWLDYERDIRADFEKAFGEPPGALVGIGVMTDSDNTQSQARAWYGPLHLSGR